MQRLVNLIDKPLSLDKKALEDTGLDMRRLVSYPGDVTAQTALRSVLQSQGLTYVVKDRTIFVVTLDKAREALVTRSYYLGRLDRRAGTIWQRRAVWPRGRLSADHAKRGAAHRLHQEVD